MPKSLQRSIGPKQIALFMKRNIPAITSQACGFIQNIKAMREQRFYYTQYKLEADLIVYYTKCKSWCPLSLLINNSHMRLISISSGKVSPLFGNHHPDYKSVASAIRKKSISTLQNPATVEINNLGGKGDEQANLSVHGGLEKAIYVYPVEHYAFWNELLTRKTKKRDTARIWGNWWKLHRWRSTGNRGIRWRQIANWRAGVRRC